MQELLSKKFFEYLTNKVFYPDFAKGFFYPEETLFCEWEEGTEEYFQHQVCEHIFNELVVRDYLKFYRPQIDLKSVEIRYNPDLAQSNSITETLTKEFIEFINAGYYLAVCESFPTNIGEEIFEALPEKTKLWLTKKSRSVRRK